MTDRFVLRAIDPVYGCSVLEAIVPISDLDALRRLIGPGADDDPGPEHIYTLDPDEVRSIAGHFRIAFDPISKESVLCRFHSSEDVPYFIHTNFELFLMLDGRKPFSIFSVPYQTEADEDAIGPIEIIAVRDEPNPTRDASVPGI